MLYINRIKSTLKLSVSVSNLRLLLTVSRSTVLVIKRSLLNSTIECSSVYVHAPRWQAADGKCEGVCTPLPISFATIFIPSSVCSSKGEHHIDVAWLNASLGKGRLKRLIFGRRRSFSAESRRRSFRPWNCHHTYSAAGDTIKRALLHTTVH